MQRRQTAKRAHPSSRADARALSPRATQRQPPSRRPRVISDGIFIPRTLARARSPYARNRRRRRRRCRRQSGASERCLYGGAAAAATTTTAATAAATTRRCARIIERRLDSSNASQALQLAASARRRCERELQSVFQSLCWRIKSSFRRVFDLNNAKPPQSLPEKHRPRSDLYASARRAVWRAIALLNERRRRRAHESASRARARTSVKRPLACSQLVVAVCWRACARSNI